MGQRSAKLRRGDFVEVKAPDEILQTLDAEGASDHLPFMPEMLEFCGRRFRVSRRALTICFSGPGASRGFRTDDVLTLDGVRCSGSAHDSCQKACMIFWRENWLRKVEDTAVQSQVDLRGMDRLRARLKVSTAPKIYYCQASELSKVTHFLSKWERLARYMSGLRSGNFNALQMAQSIGTWLLENPQDVSRRVRARKQRVRTGGGPEPPAWRMGRSEIDGEYRRDLEREGV
jgi:hypothetical protein